jgi:Holliday junction DNA helicase RuvA
MVVREDSLTLYAFGSDDERDIFEQVQTVSGVGPRLAMATLAVLEPDRLRAALADGNLSVLTQVPGVGRKSAERLVVELRDKVGKLPVAGDGVAHASSQAGVRDSVVEALTGLGFALKQAEQAVDHVLAENGTGDTSTVLRKALTTLGRKK